MSLSDIFTGLLPGTDAEPESPDAPRGANVDGPTTVVYECRNCGTTVDPKTSRCPHCDHDEIVEYPID
ncbi:zinc ribbon domain-containing protein [Natronosalvus rutilus]|uniref:Zinc ribbon domain-containing protein n=1 Tax=Natronosalvus rutilus TaxID=2953753 RepID=A0A9E7SYF2_9EURY|nr:zinc ribbon domain-containing protein [Natronosalvus rutilus]UTF55018.1 zinc ribbon domain-containing protein [Natronosalvus rutilus]